MLDECREIVVTPDFENGLLEFLLGDSGKWMNVAEFCRKWNYHINGLTGFEHMFWMPWPEGGVDCVVIMFYDTEELDSMAATYNKARLQESVAERVLARRS
ncbi:MAG TPA: hypothetical protein VLF18_05065 [Tahibacter sp.]|uniref:hypothetical protein n=1 Tax=Tahibacter sp. TaxID=2056211 RepID=UPI002C41BCC5|nr:hypothetical protein [Tahibacter sp.]HSX59549.1 hypothetical protein [Tahibacter sp.]